ncbi:glutathione S-transferase family protein [Sphingomonas rubra]|uniref:Glutathione S-transferase n=1 Tax=Sphingomonas rubra TaxID=634430 RepID=A0A1I5U4S0_9SPHN|nr:glutathione S-transferase family protein [Sphingomonas rubra]SFP90264.1 glutathione S-transferase [Sphingomonas rubra]
MTLTFYTNPQSRGRIVRWMLEETGASYDIVVLGYADSMKSDDYRAINPMMKVPAIVHDGRVVTETAAICAYLADAFPQAGLAPRTDEERAAYYRWMFFAAGPMETAIINKSMGVEPDADQQRMAGYGNFALAAGVLEQAVATTRFVAGDRFTAADVYVGSGIGWYTRFGLLPQNGVFDAYLERIESRDAFKRAGELDDAAAAAAS